MIGLVLFCALYGFRAPLIEKVDPRCYAEEITRAWVYFTDKGVTTESYERVLQSVQDRMGQQSLERRAKRGGVTDYSDIPLYEEYIHDVQAHGGFLIRASKWLNAASFWILREDLDAIAALDCVHKIARVASFSSPGDHEAALQDTALFGLTYPQLNMFNIPRLHEQGFFGSTVKVGVLDTGLRRTHSAVESVSVIAEHDFLDGDQIFLLNSPITPRYGVYEDIMFHKTTTRLNLFCSGDTTYNVYPVRDILYTFSTDGGVTWQPQRKITNHGFRNWAQDMTVCGPDTMFIFYRDNFSLKYIIYKDTVLVSSTLAGHSYHEPSAVQILDTVYVTYHDKTNLYLQKGTFSGFSANQSIASSASLIKSPKIVANNAELGILYNTYPDDSLYFMKDSFPLNFWTRVLIGNGKNADALVSQDTIFLIWKDASNQPLFRVAFTKMYNFGDSIASPVFLSENLPSLGKISLAKFAERIRVSWESAGNIYYCNSFDNGLTFTPPDSLQSEFSYLPTLGTNNDSILTFYCMRGDSLTDGYSPGDPDYIQPHHGTEMLGIIGGYLRNAYVGVAPGVQFLVAKTERRDSLYEYPIEEDTWVTGLEWVESQGADIANSSLGYTDWYDWPDDFDGMTSPASIAAREAARRGVIIVNSSGNVSGPQIVIPGDAEGVITVGGIDSLFNRWQYSGYFPTPDHSVKKPELVCLSDAPVVVDPDSINSYLYSTGTSGAAALVSGICALLLEGHPTWNLDSVRNALFTTASYADTPSDSMGYGWPDAYAAFYTSPTPFDTLAGPRFLTPFPNPLILPEHAEYIATMHIPFELDKSYTVEMRIYSITGRLIKKESLGFLLPGRYIDDRAFVWDGLDEDGERVSTGLYYCLLNTHGGKNAVTKIAVVR